MCSAVMEDANRAIEMKNGTSVGGRTIGVKHAMHRASLEQRRSKATQGYDHGILVSYVLVHHILMNAFKFLLKFYPTFSPIN